MGYVTKLWISYKKKYFVKCIIELLPADLVRTVVLVVVVVVILVVAIVVGPMVLVATHNSHVPHLRRLKFCMVVPKMPPL